MLSDLHPRQPVHQTVCCVTGSAAAEHVLIRRTSWKGIAPLTVDMDIIQTGGPESVVVSFHPSLNVLYA